MPADPSLDVEQISAQLCMVARFPWKTRLSFVIGYFKVDPTLKKHRDARGYAKVEAYATNLGDNIQFMQPIRKR